LRQGQQKGSQALGGDGAQQPADVEARGAQHRVQRITAGTLQPAAIHAVIALGVADGWLDGLAALEPLALLRVERLELAAVDDLHRRAGFVDTAKAQIDNGGGRRNADVLQQRGGLLDLFGQRVAVYGLPANDRAPTIKPY
jgi:hypothetical protein